MKSYKVGIRIKIFSSIKHTYVLLPLYSPITNSMRIKIISQNEKV